MKGKTAIVTGGAGMIGTMICNTIRKAGGRAISVDIKPSDYTCDITDYDAVSRLSLTFDKVDILVNNAIGNQKPVRSWSQDWHNDLAIGLTGAVNMLYFLEPKLIASNGVVLNIGSDLSLIGPDQSLYPDNLVKPLSYSVVKHGMIGLTRYFASLWGGKVRVNCLCPGGVDVGQKVPRSPMNRLARLDELAGPVAFLLSDASSFMTGAVVSVDGGRTAV